MRHLILTAPYCVYMSHAADSGTCTSFYLHDQYGLFSLFGRLHIHYPELMMLHDDQYDDDDGDDNHGESI